MNSASRSGSPAAASDAVRCACVARSQLKPEMGDAWRALGDHLTALGDAQGADAAYAQHIKAATRDPRLLAPAAALCEGDIPTAEPLLRNHLKRFPTDVVAIRMLAEVAARLGRYRDSETLLARCLELAPGFNAARHNYALVLQRQDRFAEALREVERLLQADPTDTGGRNLKAALLGRLGEVQQSVEIYRQVLEQFPTHPKVWHSYGHALRTAGQQAGADRGVPPHHRAVTRLRRGLLEPRQSQDLPIFQRRHRADARPAATATDLSVDDRFHFHFALGKALEDSEDYQRSFEHYAEGNRLRRSVIVYEADAVTERVDQTKALVHARVPRLAQRQRRHGAGPDIHRRPSAGRLDPARADPVEPFRRRRDHGASGHRRDRAGPRQGERRAAKCPPTRDSRDAGATTSCGRWASAIIESTRIQRKTDAPYFIDKNPNNWMHAGLIQLILPNAKIIDARRHPMSCCFSVFKQHFARGNRFSYDLAELGRYYRDYVDLMAHFDLVMPGRIHRAIYERVVEDTEAEVRRLLDYCGLPFEEGCLRFYENERAVRTASSEQVRQADLPGRPGAVDPLPGRGWARCEQALGPVLENWSGSNRC